MSTSLAATSFPIDNHNPLSLWIVKPKSPTVEESSNNPDVAHEIALKKHEDHLLESGWVKDGSSLTSKTPRARRAVHIPPVHPYKQAEIEKEQRHKKRLRQVTRLMGNSLATLHELNKAYSWQSTDAAFNRKFHEVLDDLTIQIAHARDAVGDNQIETP